MTSGRLWLPFGFLFVFVFSIFCGCGDDNPGSIPQNEINPGTGSPESAWRSLQWSINNRDLNSWAEVLDNEFSYSPDPVTDSKFPNVFAGWTISNEVVFAGLLVHEQLAMSADLVQEDFDIPEPVGDTVLWESVEYRFQVSGSDNSSPVEYSGIANLRFRKNGEFWYLLSWSDLQGGRARWNPSVVLPTLGELRAVFRAK